MRTFKNIWPFLPIHEQQWRQKHQPGQPIVIEIGAGAGLHAIQYAKMHPNTLFIPIERTKKKAQALIQRVNTHPDLHNLLPVYGDAIEWICRHCLAEEIDAYYILYPNPYPKAKQANKRFMFMPFMEKLISTLKPNGTITLATNIESYYQEAKNSYPLQWGLEILSDSILSKNSKPRTHFEKKYLERGERCYDLIFVKNS